MELNLVADITGLSKENLEQQSIQTRNVNGVFRILTRYFQLLLK